MLQGTPVGLEQLGMGGDILAAHVFVVIVLCFVFLCIDCRRLELQGAPWIFDMF